MADRAHQLRGAGLRVHRLPPDHVFTINDLQLAKMIVSNTFRRGKPNSLEDINRIIAYSDPRIISGVNDPVTQLLESLALTTGRKWVVAQGWRNGYCAWDGDVAYAYTEEGWDNRKRRGPGLRR